MDDLKIKLDYSFKMLRHNQVALCISKNPDKHDRTKRIEIDCHFIDEKIESKTIWIEYVPNQHQVANIIIKPLHRETFNKL